MENNDFNGSNPVAGNSFPTEQSNNSLENNKNLTSTSTEASDSIEKSNTTSIPSTDTNSNKSIEVNADTSPYDLVTGSGYDEPKKPNDSAKVPFDMDFGTDEDLTPKRDLHQEALERNKIAYSGMTSTGVSPEMTKALGIQDAIADLAKENTRLEEQNKMLMERLDKIQATLDRLTGHTSAYEQDPALAAALNPNKPNDPRDEGRRQLEQVQESLIKEQDRKQAEFTKQVQEEDKLHNPLNPEHNVVNPELTDTTAAEAATKAIEEQKKQRDEKKAALMAGVVGGAAGLTIGLLGGLPVATVGAAVCGGILTLGRLGDKRIGQLEAKIRTSENPEEKAKLEKRVATWGKICGAIGKAKNYLTGAVIGFGVAGLASGLFMHNQGFLNGGLAHNSASVTGTGSVSGAESNSIKTDGDFRQSGYNIGSSNSNSVSATGSNFDSGLIQNGRVHLPGSAWDGNLATAPTGNFTGEALNSVNYAGGATNMGAYNLDRVLDSARISVEQIQNAGGDVHRLLNIYQANPTANLAEALSNVGAGSLIQ